MRDPGSAKQQVGLLLKRRRFVEAQALAERLIGSGGTGSGGLCSALGVMLADHGQLHAAVRCFQRAIEHNPRDADAHNNLGYLAFRTRQLVPAERHLKQAIQLSPGFARAYVNLSNVLTAGGRYSEAITALSTAIHISPNDSGLRNDLGILLAQQGDYQAALEQFLEAGRLDPKSAEIPNNLAKLRRGLGEYAAAVESYRRALALRPGFSEAHSNLLFTLAYNVLCPPEELLEEHREYGRRFGGEGRARTFTHPRGGDPDKRLKVGYVSPDLKRHAVSYFFEPILEAHDRGEVEVYCYAEVAQPDAVTERLKGEAEHWRSTVGLTDEALARQIHADGIDILVDLAGHTAHNRLPAFAYRPAPVQVTYLGYCTTTGLETMDYWITDAVLTPEATVERTVEEIWRLPRCWLSYRPDPQAPAVLERPSDAPLTFGSFNNLSKLTDRVVSVWSEILQAVPGARLLLKTRELTSEWARGRTFRQFVQRGISEQQLEMRAASADYLNEYGEVDIVLDPFPRTGGATTADALWMGVPVVTLAGGRMIERQGASMLTAVGLPELIAGSEADYIAKAVALARDPGRRAALRAGLRPLMAASELCDKRGLAAALETAYREMWLQYVRR
jgi:predicted O-linked N-acetylglucosamine transferase (SPINDLY family)